MFSNQGMYDFGNTKRLTKKCCAIQWDELAPKFRTFELREPSIVSLTSAIGSELQLMMHNATSPTPYSSDEYDCLVFMKVEIIDKKTGHTIRHSLITLVTTSDGLPVYQIVINDGHSKPSGWPLTIARLSVGDFNPDIHEAIVMRKYSFAERVYMAKKVMTDMAIMEYFNI